jgi:hypothetical protein
MPEVSSARIRGTATRTGKAGHMSTRYAIGT